MDWLVLRKKEGGIMGEELTIKIENINDMWWVIGFLGGSLICAKPFKTQEEAMEVLATVIAEPTKDDVK